MSCSGTCLITNMSDLIQYSVARSQSRQAPAQAGFRGGATRKASCPARSRGKIDDGNDVSWLTDAAVFSPNSTFETLDFPPSLPPSFPLNLRACCTQDRRARASACHVSMLPAYLAFLLGASCLQAALALVSTPVTGLVPCSVGFLHRFLLSKSPM